MTEADAACGAVEETTVFAEVDPNEKERIILALKKRGHVVGYMGDGINDAPSLHSADVGISVENAVDVAKEAADLAKTLASMIELVYQTFNYLRHKKYSYIQDLCVEIHGLENQGDEIFRATLGKMFDEMKDPILIIKWKEIYENLENATDSCEDVANILESIVLKYA